MTDYELTAMFDCGCRWRGSHLMPCSRHTEDELRARIDALPTPTAIDTFERRLF